MKSTTPTSTHNKNWYIMAINRLPLCGRRVGLRTRWFLLAAFILYGAYNYYSCQLSGSCQWDYLLLSGIASLWFGLLAVAPVDGEFNDLISRLVIRGVLPKKLDQSGFGQLFDEKLNLTARAVALVSAVAMLIAFAVSVNVEPRIDKALLALPAAFVSYIAGSFLGRMVSYGRLSSSLVHAGLQIKIFPEHIDGVGGLKPVGDFYFKQAMIAAIPVLFLGIWSVIFPFWTGKDYSDWTEPYLGLLIIALIIMLLAFVVPMNKFHVLMDERKREALLEADRLSRLAQEELDSPDPDSDLKEIADRIAALHARYWRIENMPVWPLHLTTLKRFQRNYILLTTPLITRLVNDNTKVGELVAEFLKALSLEGM